MKWNEHCPSYHTCIYHVYLNSPIFWTKKHNFYLYYFQRWIINNSNTQCTTDLVLFYIGMLQEAYSTIRALCSLRYYCETRRPSVVGSSRSLTRNKAINFDQVYRCVIVCSIVSNCQHIKTQAFCSVWLKMAAACRWDVRGAIKTSVHSI